MYSDVTLEQAPPTTVAFKSSREVRIYKVESRVYDVRFINVTFIGEMGVYLHLFNNTKNTARFLTLFF